jgi:hypothetical protein
MPPSSLPDRVPREAYAVLGALTDTPALAWRMLARQETWKADENPRWIRLETSRWKRYRFASREAKAYDGKRNSEHLADRLMLFAEMDAVCAADAEINPAAADAAILSHSIGFSQILGEGHKFAGHNTARGFWRAMQTLDGQVMATAEFAKTSPRLLVLMRRLDPTPRTTAAGKRLRLGDLSEIASIWNGPAFEKTGHDKGLQVHLAFARKEGGHAVAMA